jgi:hypothetical protein
MVPSGASLSLLLKVGTSLLCLPTLPGGSFWVRKAGYRTSVGCRGGGEGAPQGRDQVQLAALLGEKRLSVSLWDEDRFVDSSEAQREAQGLSTHSRPAVHAESGGIGPGVEQASAVMHTFGLNLVVVS